MITTEKTNILLRYLQQQLDKRVRLFFTVTHESQNENLCSHFIEF